MDLMSEFIDEAAKQLAKDIDTEVMMSLMGWKECNLTISDGTVFGKRYLTVHPSNSGNWNEIMEWMIEQFGSTPEDGVWTPDMRWYANNSKFWFRDEADLLLFILRWQ